MSCAALFRTVHRRVFACLTLLLAAACAPAASPSTAPTPGASGERSEKPDLIFVRFAGQWDDDMRAAAARRNLQAPEFSRELMEGARAYDWAATSNAFQKMAAPIRNGTSSSPRTLLWQYNLEVFGAFEQFAPWPPSLIDLYGREILGVIPDGGVYFGGTDAGRFVVTAYQVGLRRPFVVITQNALADCTYLDYLHETVRASVLTPSTNDSTLAFQQFVQEWKAGKAPAGASLQIVDGRVQVSGVEAVMAINGILARSIFDWNKAKHPFFVEESYVIPWMYPYLRPAGPILKLEADELPGPQQNRALWDGMVARDKEYWDRLTNDLIGRPAFQRSPEAAKAFSKLRCAIAGVYGNRELAAEAEYAYRQALRLCPQSPEGHFRLAELYLQARRYNEARALLIEFQRIDPDNRNVTPLLQKIDAASGKPQTSTNSAARAPEP
jgi:hypothetical protein